MDKKKIILILAIVFSIRVWASEVPSWKLSVKNVLVKMVSEDTANQWLGIEKSNDIVLPAIPKVIKKASSAESYNRSAIDSQGKSFNELPVEKRRQFEFNFLQELIEVVLKTTPREDDLGKWMNVLDQGGSREGLYRAMALGEEYYALEGVEKSPSDGLINYAIQFSERYLGKSWKKESLSKNNLFTIKRIITESGLEVMDELSKKPEDVYAWYAVISAEMAKDYSKLFTGKLRVSTDSKVHYQWAQSAPYQHIKSEFIIKLHTVMNSLDN